MEVICSSDNQITMKLSKDELRGITNSINEVTRGFGWDFSGTDWTKPKALALLDAINQNSLVSRNQAIVLDLTKDQIAFILQAMSATIDELDWEYSIRMGYTINEAKQLQVELQGAL